MSPPRQRPRRPKTEKQKIRAEKAAATKAKAKQIQKRVAKAPANQLEGFLDFIRQRGIIGLAIGLVLGIQIKAVVDQLIASFINPLLGLVLPGQGALNEKTFFWTVPLLDKSATFTYGAFIYTLLSFVVVALVIYYLVIGLKLDKLDKPKE